jgi:hypothetical protein
MAFSASQHNRSHCNYNKCDFRSNIMGYINNTLIKNEMICCDLENTAASMLILALKIIKYTLGL